MLSPGTLLSQEWYSSSAGKAVQAALLTRNLLKKKPFGAYLCQGTAVISTKGGVYKESSIKQRIMHMHYDIMSK